MRVVGYFDITCAECGRSASTDWNTGFFKNILKAKLWAKENGWKYAKGYNHCKECYIKCYPAKANAALKKESKV